MKEIIELALAEAKRAGANYVDARIVRTKNESLSVKNGAVEVALDSFEQGIGIRTLVGGAFGFAATFDLTENGARRAAVLSVETAKASARQKRVDATLAKVEPVVAKYTTPFKVDPFKIPLDEKLGLLIGLSEKIRTVKGVNIASSSLRFTQKKQIFASSEGAFIEQTILMTGAGMEAIAIGGGQMQIRSYPNSHGGQFITGGYELIDELSLGDKAEGMAKEAVALLGAKECPSTTTSLILGSSQLALQIHESIGHPAELDRALGSEASFAGMSFLTTDKLGNYRVGSNPVNIVADATAKRGLGSFSFDDEGVAASSFHIVKDGIFLGYLNSRQTAAAIGLKPNGSMRAGGYNRIPLIRMTNVSLSPGEESLGDLIASTKEGILMDTNKSWSIDDKRLNFQFATEIAWQIRNGRIEEILKNPNYTGKTPTFWGSCSAIADKDSWVIWGTPNCGKGEPMQVVGTGHGASPAKFEAVEVGVGK